MECVCNLNLQANKWHLLIWWCQSAPDWLRLCSQHHMHPNTTQPDNILLLPKCVFTNSPWWDQWSFILSLKKLIKPLERFHSCSPDLGRQPKLPARVITHLSSWGHCVNGRGLICTSQKTLNSFQSSWCDSHVLEIQSDTSPSFRI